MSPSAEHHAGALARGIPLSSKIVIVTAAAVLFGLGAIYLEQHRKVVTSFYQVMGVRALPRGTPAAFLVIQYDAAHKELVPVLVEAAALRTTKGTFPGRPVARTPVVAAVVQFDALDLPVGSATLVLTVVPWEGTPRNIEIPVEVTPPTDPGPMVRPIAPEMPHEEFARIETLPMGDVILGERDNPLWIRVSDGQDRALEAHAEIFLDGIRVSELSLGPLGLGTGIVHLTKPNHSLKVVAAVSGVEGIRTEDLAPMGLIRILPQPPVLRDPLNDHVVLSIESETVTERLFCGLWRGDALTSLFAVPTEEGRARYELSVPGEGLYRVTCTDHPQSEWWGDSYFLAAAKPSDPLDRYRVALKDERFFQSWPRSEDLSPDLVDTALGYLLDRTVRTELPYERLLSTLDTDQEALEAEGRRVRLVILALIGGVGLSLLLWAVALVLRQRRSLDPTRIDPDYLDEMGDDLGDVGLGRKGLMLPAVCLILAALVNVAALIYILILILY
ncbi:MAG: hypothetical protein ABIK09_04805 [Pseudomonadota bacterium]